MINKSYVIEAPMWADETEEYLYEIIGTKDEGVWEISNNKAKIIGEKNQLQVKIGIITGRSGSFVLRYVREGLDAIELPITIESL